MGYCLEFPFRKDGKRFCEMVYREDVPEGTIRCGCTVDDKHNFAGWTRQCVGVKEQEDTVE